jgi:myo-inositol-1(or 4)-monophosphatase
MTDRLATAQRAAIEAGQLLLDYRHRDLSVQRKGRIDLVSEADRAAEELVRRRLTTAFPGEIIVGEEGAHVPEDEVAGRSRWYVDPLDGTTNYLHGSDRWAVSIAWCSPNDRIEVAVVHLPATSETFTATHRGGAHLDGAPIQVTEASSLDEAVIASGFPYDLETGPTNLQEWAAITRRARSMRCLGAAAIDLCDVARGQLDGFWEQRLGRWDTAAGILIAAEAGARISDMAGHPLAGASEDVVAAGPVLEGLLLEALRVARTDRR